MVDIEATEFISLSGPQFAIRNYRAGMRLWSLVMTQHEVRIGAVFSGITRCHDHA
jgi:hypothetical protein